MLINHSEQYTATDTFDEQCLFSYYDNIDNGHNLNQAYANTRLCNFHRRSCYYIK